MSTSSYKHIRLLKTRISCTLVPSIKRPSPFIAGKTVENGVGKSRNENKAVTQGSRWNWTEKGEDSGNRMKVEQRLEEIKKEDWCKERNERED